MDKQTLILLLLRSNLKRVHVLDTSTTTNVKKRKDNTDIMPGRCNINKYATDWSDIYNIITCWRLLTSKQEFWATNTTWKKAFTLFPKHQKTEEKDQPGRKRLIIYLFCLLRWYLDTFLGPNATADIFVAKHFSDISVNLLRPDEASRLAGVSRYFHTIKKALTFTSTFSSTQWKPTASTPLPSPSVRTEVRLSLLKPHRAPGVHRPTGRFPFLGADLVSNGSHGALGNFQVGLISPLNDQRATQRRSVRYFLFSYQVNAVSSYLQSKARQAHTHKVAFTHRGRLIFSFLWAVVCL